LASDGAIGDNFGSVAIYRDYALVGADWDDNENGVDAGALYIFDRNAGGANNWGGLPKIPGPGPGYRFGGSVDISGDYAIVGAAGKDSYRGAAYVYHRGTGGWTQMGNVIESCSV